MHTPMDTCRTEAPCFSTQHSVRAYSFNTEPPSMYNFQRWAFNVQPASRIRFFSFLVQTNFGDGGHTCNFSIAACVLKRPGIGHSCSHVQLGTVKLSRRRHWIPVWSSLIAEKRGADTEWLRRWPRERAVSFPVTPTCTRALRRWSMVYRLLFSNDPAF